MMAATAHEATNWMVAELPAWVAAIFIINCRLRLLMTPNSMASWRCAFASLISRWPDTDSSAASVTSLTLCCTWPLILRKRLLT